MRVISRLPNLIDGNTVTANRKRGRPLLTSQRGRGSLGLKADSVFGGPAGYADR
jgi:hypothetical protein